MSFQRVQAHWNPTSIREVTAPNVTITAPLVVSVSVWEKYGYFFATTVLMTSQPFALNPLCAVKQGTGRFDPNIIWQVGCPVAKMCHAIS